MKETKKERPKARPVSDLGDYLSASRRLSVSFVAVLPILALYEIGIIVSRSPVENHAGLLVRRMIGLLGVHAYAALTGLVALTFFVALVLKVRGPARRFGLYGLMVVESAIYAVLIGPLAIRIGVHFHILSAAGGEPGPVLRGLLYVGAGVWEELVFRLLLMGGVIWITVSLLKGNRIVFSLFALLLSSFVFSAFHHVGAMAEPYAPGPFLFRFFAGMVLGSIFLFRGLGIAVYTHALYNVSLLLHESLS